MPKWVLILLAISILFACGIGLKIIGGSRTISIEERWSKGFVEVAISSSIDQKPQPAVFFPSPEASHKPLLVSLHAWSSDYSDLDPLAEPVKKLGWNYIHPQFRGENNKPEACLSTLALSDIEDAIRYAIEHSNVDMRGIFVVGGSGGGYAALGVYIRSKHPIAAIQSWVPISDLEAWYWQSKARGSDYAEDIVRCTTEDGVFDPKKARARSPLAWEFEGRKRTQLDIYAGINDGYLGGVPISHSIQFFNKVAVLENDKYGAISLKDTVQLLTRGMSFNTSLPKIEDRQVLYSKTSGNTRLTIFDGGHEILNNHVIERFTEIWRNRHNQELNSTDEK